MNIKKHAGVNTAEIHVEETTQGEFIVEVSDPGKGFDLKTIKTANSGHYGLFSITERLSSLGVQVDFRTAPGEGCQVRLVTPKAIR